MIWPGEKTAGFCSSFSKINPNAVDLAPIGVFRIPDDAVIFLKGAERGYIVGGKFFDQAEIKEPLLLDPDGFYNISPGTYEIRLPKISIPRTATGFCYPRTSLFRLGAIKSETAVWDSGYEGEGSQTFFFPLAARIHKGEAWVQMVFMANEGEPTGSYSGHYQGETVAAKKPSGKLG